MTQKEIVQSSDNSGNEDEQINSDIATHFFDSKFVQAIINEFEVTKAAEVFQRDVKEVEAWEKDKNNLPCKQVLVKDIYPKVKNFVLQDYKDCLGLHMLKDTFAPNPKDGRYAPYLDKLIDAPSEVTIKPCKNPVPKVDFVELVCLILQDLEMVTLKTIIAEDYQSSATVVYLTKKGVAYLIRDRLHQRREFDKLDDESVSKYVSQIKFGY